MMREKLWKKFQFHLKSRVMIKANQIVDIWVQVSGNSHFLMDTFTEKLKVINIKNAGF